MTARLDEDFRGKNGPVTRIGSDDKTSNHFPRSVCQ